MQDPEKTIKRRMNAALEKFRILHNREIGNNEDFKDEHRTPGYRVTLSGHTRFSRGQATYEGPEGTWLCWMTKDSKGISGTPYKHNNTAPSFEDLAED